MLDRTVGRYRIVAKLGEGGMGTVWRAEDPLLNRTVALKFLPESLADDADARRRFLREARTVSVLNHSGIAAVYDAGEIDGQVYIAMHLVDGETIGERVSRTGPLAIPAAICMARDTAAALAHAHMHGVIHRDVTARNIMVDKSGQVYVVDFGLALALGATRLTTVGTTMGTAGYMAPEIIRGGTADARSDLYGLGVVLYEMLTGSVPFAAERPEAVLYAAVHKVPEPPVSLRADTPEALNSVILALMEKDPAWRYQNAADLASDLQSILVDEKPLHLPTSRQDVTVTLSPLAPAPVLSESAMPARAGSGPRSQRKGFSRRAARLGAILIVLLGTGIALWRWGAFQSTSRGAYTLAVLPLQNLSSSPQESAYIGRAIGATLTEKLAQIGLSVVPWSISERHTSTNQMPSEIAMQLSAQKLLTGTLQTSGERILVNLSIVDPRSGLQEWVDEFEGRKGEIALLHGRIGMGIAAQLHSSLTPAEQAILEGAASGNSAALDRHARGQWALAQGTAKGLTEARVQLQEAVALDPNFALAHVDLGVANLQMFCYGWAGRDGLRDAERSLRRSLELDPQLHAARGNLALALREQGLIDTLLHLIEVPRQEGAGSREARVATAEAWIAAGFPDQAVDVLRQVLQEDSRHAQARRLLALSLYRLGDWEMASREIELYTEWFGPDQEMLLYLGESNRLRGALEAAKADLDRAMQTRPDEDSAVDVFLHAGRLYAMLQGRGSTREGEGEQILRRGLSLLDARLQGSPDNYRLRAIRVGFLGSLGDSVAARAQADSVLRDFAGNGNAAELLAYFSALSGDKQRAVALFRLAIQWGATDPSRLVQSGVGSDPGYSELRSEYERAQRAVTARYAAARHNSGG